MMKDGEEEDIDDTVVLADADDDKKKGGAKKDFVPPELDAKATKSSDKEETPDEKAAKQSQTIDALADGPCEERLNMTEW